MKKKPSKRLLEQYVDDMLAHYEQTIGLENIAELKKGFLTPPDEEPSVSRPAGKKRGAPAGNQNARKHGLYSKIAPARRRGAMGKAQDMEDLSQEIVALRLFLLDLMANPEAHYKDILQGFRVLTQMVKANRMLEDPDDGDQW